MTTRRKKRVIFRAARQKSVNITLEGFAKRIAEDAEALRAADSALFLRVAKEITAKANEIEASMTGDKHPLAAFLAKPRDEDFIQRLDEGIAEYRALTKTAEK